MVPNGTSRVAACELQPRIEPETVNIPMAGRIRNSKIPIIIIIIIMIKPVAPVSWPTKIIYFLLNWSGTVSLKT